MDLLYGLNYPAEYRLGKHIARRVQKQFCVALPNSEATGIALNIINARLGAATEAEKERERQDDNMLEDVTEIIEDDFGIDIDRSSFAFSRYATHMRYLFERLHSGEVLDSSCVNGFRGIEEQYPREAACVAKISQHIEGEWDGAVVSNDERLYLVVHVSRLRIKGTGR